MRWLLLKDLRILRRSPLLVALLVIYPVVIAVLIGLALSRGPDKPTVAIVNEVPASQSTVQVANEKVDISKYAQKLYQSIDPVFVPTRKAAIAKVRSGDALAALIIPADITSRLQSGFEQARVQVIYNTQDPVKARFVRSTIKAKLADANAALSTKFTQVAAGYVDLLLKGGQLSIFGRTLDVLGLRNAETILRGVQRSLPAHSSGALALDQVIRFAALAIENLGLSDKYIATVGSPIKVQTTSLTGHTTSLDRYGIAVAATISLMFVTVLLAGGMLALEREEHAFSRLVRGLVSRTGLVTEKALLAAVCAFVVTVAMLGALSIFVHIDWARAPQWLGALALGAISFGGLGVAIGAIAREVRAASLLAFLLSLPIAFLALVPSGAVSTGLYDAIRAVSAIFPFKAALEATNSGINGGGAPLWQPFLHMAGLAVAFVAVARLAVRRFG